MVAFKVSTMGYFGGVAKQSRGPWFRDFFVEDDGLDWFYRFKDNDWNRVYLLSNNIALDDREKFDSLFKTMKRNDRLSWCGASYIAFEAVRRLERFKRMAHGWRFLSWVGLAGLGHHLLMDYSSQVHAPILGAYLRKYKDCVVKDMYEIKDEKKAYFYIDTSDYMNYSNATLSDQYHISHGP